MGRGHERLHLITNKIEQFNVRGETFADLKRIEKCINVLNVHIATDGFLRVITGAKNKIKEKKRSLKEDIGHKQELTQSPAGLAK